MLHSRGVHVTFLVREQSYWDNVLPKEESNVINRLIRQAGFDLKLETEYEPGTRFHKSLRADLELADGTSHVLTGTVKGFIPLRNRRAGANTSIGEGMTEYLLDGERIGYGLSEYLDQPES